MQLLAWRAPSCVHLQYLHECGGEGREGRGKREKDRCKCEATLAVGKGNVNFGTLKMRGKDSPVPRTCCNMVHTDGLRGTDFQDRLPYGTH